jgi:serine/threonine protein kinase
MIDFGLSKQFSSDLAEEMASSLKTIVGTPLYVAPEIFQGYLSFTFLFQSYIDLSSIAHSFFLKILIDYTITVVIIGALVW